MVATYLIYDNDSRKIIHGMLPPILAATFFQWFKQLQFLWGYPWSGAGEAKAGGLPPKKRLKSWGCRLE
jgi:hypothetical protein